MRNYATTMSVLSLLLVGLGTPVSAKSRLKTESTSRIVITVRSESSVDTDQISLGNIATVTCDNPALAHKLLAGNIGVSPLPGMYRILMPGDVAMHLRADSLYRSGMVINTPPSIRVDRVAHVISAQQLTDAAIAAAQPIVNAIPNAKIQAVKSMGTLNVPAGKVSIVAGAPVGTPEQGTLYVPVSVDVNGQPIQTTEITLHVIRHEEVVVADSLIQPQDIITASNISLQVMDLPPGFGMPVTDLKKVIGMRSTVRVLAGMPIPASGLVIPPDINQGEIITVLFVIGDLTITAQATSEQSGHIGDTIHVYTTSTHKLLTGTIKDKHTVLVQTGQN